MDLDFFEGVHYDKLKVRTPFFIVEGGDVVGEGIVNDTKEPAH